MEAEIKIGELNICVRCGLLSKTYELDRDDLPVCESCSDSSLICNNCKNKLISGFCPECDMTDSNER